MREVTAIIAGAVIDPLVLDLDDETLRAQLLKQARRLGLTRSGQASEEPRNPQSRSPTECTAPRDSQEAKWSGVEMLFPRRHASHSACPTKPVARGSVT
jgi:hypothetical protein